MSHVDIAIADLSPETAKTHDDLQQFSVIICNGAMLYIDQVGMPCSVSAPQTRDAESLMLLQAARKHAPDVILLRVSLAIHSRICEIHATGDIYLHQEPWKVTYEMEIDGEKLAMDKCSFEKFLDARKRVKHNGPIASPGDA